MALEAVTSDCCEINAIWRMISKTATATPLKTYYGFWSLKLLGNHLLTKLLKVGVLFAFQGNGSINSKSKQFHRSLTKALHSEAGDTLEAAARTQQADSWDPDPLSSCSPGQSAWQ